MSNNLEKPVIWFGSSAETGVLECACGVGQYNDCVS